MRVADYKELRVYRLAFESAMQIFELSRTWPSEERFSLTGQIRRSSRSVCTNLAEAWRKRRYEAAFVSKLSDSDGEAAETVSYAPRSPRSSRTRAPRPKRSRNPNAPRS